jgi:hypothetical protein
MVSMIDCCVDDKQDTSLCEGAVSFEIKKCPVCGAGVFSDMHTCFNCMHKFEEGDLIYKNQAPEVCACETTGAQDCLFNEFLVEFERFLVEFLVNRRVNLE